MTISLRVWPIRRQLMLPGEMGERFKAMAVARGLDLPLAGFALQELGAIRCDCEDPRRRSLDTMRSQYRSLDPLPTYMQRIGPAKGSGLRPANQQRRGSQQ